VKDRFSIEYKKTTGHISAGIPELGIKSEIWPVVFFIP